jgi:tRNA G18 (ribose-2'-O)-methylase SpoU
MPLDPPLDQSAEEIRAALEPLRNDVSVAVIAAGNAFAVGAIIRTCHSFLVREVLLVGTETHYEKASMGMHRLERVVRLADEDALFAHTAGRPLFVLERERARRSLYDVARFPEGAVLVFGSERFGVPARVMARADEILAIPIYGVNSSLPVAVAAGITLSWWAHGRYGEGAVVIGPRR